MPQLLKHEVPEVFKNILQNFGEAGGVTKCNPLENSLENSEQSNALQAEKEKHFS